MNLYFGPFYSSLQSPGHRVFEAHTRNQPLRQCSFVHVFSLHMARGIDLRLSDDQVKALSDQIYPSIPVKTLKGTYYAQFTSTCCLNINMCLQCVHNHPTMIKIHRLFFYPHKLEAVSHSKSLQNLSNVTSHFTCPIHNCLKY